MNAIAPYLAFPGTCREAIEFYRECFGAEVESMQSFGDGPMDVPPDHRDKIMHAHIRAGDLELMASDGMPGNEITPGGQVTLSLHFDEADEQSRIWELLAEGGEIRMPLQDTFWGARFGMLKDRFGIAWMLNCGHDMGKKE